MVKSVYNIDKEIFKSKVVIFGTGEWGKRAFFTLLEEGIKVDFFADRKKECEYLLGKPILLEEELIGKDYTVIVASTYWKEIADRLSAKGLINVYVMNRFAMNSTGVEV